MQAGIVVSVVRRGYAISDMRKVTFHGISCGRAALVFGRVK